MKWIYKEDFDDFEEAKRLALLRKEYGLNVEDSNKPKSKQEIEEEEFEKDDFGFIDPEKELVF